MKNLIVFCFSALLSQAAFAQQPATTTPAAEKKACCAAGSAKAGASCSASTAATTIVPIAQPIGMVKKVAVVNNQLQTAQFQVWGNCAMCKKTIEKAANDVTGVEKAEWNVETHQFMVVLDPAKTSVDKVHQAIAAAGYDTDLVKGNDEAYNRLHGCCQYERRN